LTTWYAALEPGTWADWALVLVGAVGSLAAVLTLNALRKQTQRAAEETVLLHRAYLHVDSWMPSVAFFKDLDGSQGADCDIKFRIFNASKTAARVEEIKLKYKGTEGTQQIGRMLVVGECTWGRISVRTKVGDTFRVDGVVTYRDTFKKVRHRTFAQMIICTADGCRTEEAEGAGANDEREWNEG
jgi:hypothetical protein